MWVQQREGAHDSRRRLWRNPRRRAASGGGALASDRSSNRPTSSWRIRLSCKTRRVAAGAVWTSSAAQVLTEGNVRERRQVLWRARAEELVQVPVLARARAEDRDQCVDEIRGWPG